MNHAVNKLGLFLITLCIAACVSEVADESSSAEEQVGLAAQALYSQQPLGWVPGETVPVCFTTPASSPGIQAQQAQIRDAIVNTWQSISNISFDGFGLCPTTGTTKYVRVYLVTAEQGSQSAYAGKTAALKLPTPDVTDASVFLWGSINGPASALQFSAVHEFGHTLGFGHEHDRVEDTSPDPNCNYPGSIPGTSWSPYDAESIMHYCGRRDNVLSAGDVAGAQAAFAFSARSLPVSIPGETTPAGQINSSLLFEGSPNKTLRSVNVSDCCAGSMSGSTELPKFGVAAGAMDGPPAVILEGNAYSAFWKGRDRKLWFSIGANGGIWTPAVADAGPLGSVPSAALNGDRIAVFFRGADDSLYVKRWDGSNWLPPVRFNVSLALAPSVVALTAGVFEVFWQGSVDKKLWHLRSVDGGATWSSPEALLTMTGSEPRALGQSDGTTDVFWRGSDGYLMHLRRTSSGSVLPLERLNSGVLASRPVPTLSSAGKILVFWRGNDNKLWRMATILNTNIWSVATNMNEILGSSDPSAIADATGAIDVVWRDNALLPTTQVTLKRYRPATGWLSSRVITVPALF